MRGNIFQRINKDEEWFKISGEIKSIMFKGRVPDPEKPGKTKLIRKLVPAGEVMDVRGASSFFRRMVILFGLFLRKLPQSLKILSFYKSRPCVWRRSLF